MHGFEEISPITFTVGWGPGVFSGALPVWITQREDVRSICVRRGGFRAKYVKSSASVLETLLYVVGHGYAPGPKLILVTPPSIKCVGIFASGEPGAVTKFKLVVLISAYFSLVLASTYCI